MSITKSLIGLNDEHVKLLESMINKDDKRFKNKSAVVRTILDCFCSNENEGDVLGVIVSKKNGWSVFDFNNKGFLGDLLEGCNSIEITAIKDSNVRNEPKIEVNVINNNSYRM